MRARLAHTTHYKIQTPEGIALDLPVAGLWSRSAAWLIDLGIRLLIYLLLALILSFAGLFGKGLMLIAFFILEWFYPVLYEVLNAGVTPGKKIIGLKVISTNGIHIDWSTSMTRNLMRFIDMLPIIYGVGFISVLVSRYSQRIGDFIAGTIVIYQDKADLTADKLSINGISENQTQMSVAIKQLNKSERDAFKSYLDRQNELSTSRKLELLQILTPWFSQNGIPVNEQSLHELASSVSNYYEAV